MTLLLDGDENTIFSTAQEIYFDMAVYGVYKNHIGKKYIVDR